MYEQLHYRVWASIQGVYIDVMVERYDVAILGERAAVGYAVWNKLFSDFSYMDVNGKHRMVKNPTGDMLRKWAKMLGEGGVTQLKETVLRDLKYELVTIDKEA